MRVFLQAPPLGNPPRPAAPAAPIFPFSTLPLARNRLEEKVRMRLRRVHYPPEAVGGLTTRRRAFGGRAAPVIGVANGGVPGGMIMVGAWGSRGCG